MSDQAVEAFMGAWDEEDENAPTDIEPTPVAEAEAPPEDDETEEAHGTDADATAEGAGEEDDDEGHLDDEEDDDESASGEEEVEDSEAEPDADPDIAAYLARYDNDPNQALKAAIEMSKLVTRQGREKNEALARVVELEAELEAAQLFTSTPTILNEEQRTWVEAAVASDSPLLAIHQAVQAGEFDLARAVVDTWADESPYPAMRAAQMIDSAEYAQVQAAQAQQASGFDQGQFYEILTNAFPEMPTYQPQMVEVINRLGPQHPLVSLARSGDPEEAAQGVIGIYEIARASKVEVKTKKKKVTEESRQAAEAARERAQVSSSQATPSAGQTPRKQMIAPGLSMEALDAAWDE